MASLVKPLTRHGLWSLPTGVRVFMILGAVLLPLTLISILASAETGRSAAQVRGERLMAVLENAAGRLRRDLVEDQVTVAASATAQANARVENGGLLCRRVTETIRARHAGRVRFVIADTIGSPVCGLKWAGPVPLPARDEQMAEVSDGQLTLSRRDERGWVTALHYPAGELRRMAGQIDLDGQALLSLRTGSAALTLEDSLGRASRLFGMTDLSIGFTGYDLALAASVPELPPTAAQLIAILLPVLMLIGSALVGWLLVHRLFTRQLAFLTRQVESYRPGTIISLGRETTTGAQEVQALGTGLREMSQLVAENIDDVEAGLARQTSLTREVHHRVKNNLQVIASLISLHSRSAAEEGARSAYRTIQRRVEALSVVHRNHFAGTEVSSGVSLSALISELTSSLQGSAEDEVDGFTIVLSLEPASLSQDVATSVSFIVTELAELALMVGAGQTLTVATSLDGDGRVQLDLQSQAFADSAALRAALYQRYGRVLLGLSRQLRETLHHDALAGSYSIIIPVLATA